MHYKPCFLIILCIGTMIILGITHLFLDATGYYFEVMTTSGAHEGIITAPVLYNRALGNDTPKFNNVSESGVVQHGNKNELLGLLRNEEDAIAVGAHNDNDKLHKDEPNAKGDFTTHSWYLDDSKIQAPNTTCAGSEGFQILANTTTKEILSAMKTDTYMNHMLYGLGIESELKKSIKGSPLQHLSSFKNPCWISKVEVDPYKDHFRDVIQKGHSLINMFRRRHKLDGMAWRVRCLPYFYIVGISKSGTTDLFGRIVRHPDIVQPIIKECLYWDRYLKYDKAHPKFQICYYMDYFDKAGEEIYRSPELRDGKRYHHKITVDGTPTTLWTVQQWTNHPSSPGHVEPQHITAHTIRTLTPQAKFIVLLREPAERLYSHFKKVTRQGTPKQFHELFLYYLPVWNECVQTRGLRSCCYDNELIPIGKRDKISGMFIRASMYTVFLKDWMEIFPRDHFLVLKAEDYYNNNNNTLRQIFNFLDVEEPNDYDRYAAQMIRNVGVKRGATTEPILPETRMLLDGLFQPMKEELAAMLQDERFLWRD